MYDPTMFYFRHREKKLKTYLEGPPGATLLNIYLEFSHNTHCCRGVRCVWHGSRWAGTHNWQHFGNRAYLRLLLGALY